jgi:hypothetical protein
VGWNSISFRSVESCVSCDVGGVGGGEAEAATLRVFETFGSLPRTACSGSSPGGFVALKGDGYALTDGRAACKCL